MHSNHSEPGGKVIANLWREKQVCEMVWNKACPILPGYNSWLGTLMIEENSEYFGKFVSQELQYLFSTKLACGSPVNCNIVSLI